MFLTKKHLSRRTVLKGAGVTLALPLLDAMIPAATALAQTAAVAEDAHGILLPPARRDHGQHVARPRDGQVDAERLGRRLQAESDPRVARAAQALRHVVREPAEQRDGRRRAQPRARHVAERDEAGQGIGRREHVDDARSGGGEAHRPEHDAAVARSWRPKPRSRRPRAAARRASTTRRSRSATRIPRCRWSSTRARSSRSCSAKATRRKSARRSRTRRRACSIASTTARARCSAISARAIAWCSTTTWRRCARSSGACSWPRAATCPPSKCRRRRSES